MKIKLICIGKTGSLFLVQGEQEYTQRLSHYCRFEKIEIADIKDAKKMSFEQIKKKEGELILNKLQETDHIVLLDEKGKTYSSSTFAHHLQKRFNQGGKSIVFVVGGAFGFSEDVYARSNEKLSLSEMTFSHQMIRVIFLEQLYRAFTILKGEPYHHE